jgi:phosphoglycerol transferase MdoB-like AlkP superfamily enzyme
LKSPINSAKYLSALAVIVWLVGFALAFVIPPGSRLLWLPDALLLLGFAPLLISCRARWLWILFGVLNFFIGFVLLVVKYMRNDEFCFDPKILATKVHLAQYHEPFAWIIIGFFSFLTGLILVAISLAGWLSNKRKNKKA